MRASSVGKTLRIASVSVALAAAASLAVVDGCAPGRCTQTSCSLGDVCAKRYPFNNDAAGLAIGMQGRDCEQDTGFFTVPRSR
jgi:hypothetical protein